jgi:uncharacterized protein
MKLPITPHQEAIARRVLAQESEQRHHLVVALTGAHAYGFSSPDSDLDLKGVHLAKTRTLLGFQRSADHANRMELIEGVEIDYSSNELGQVLGGIVKGIGSFYERLLGTWIAQAGPELAELRPLVVRSFSRRIHAHYRGFATSQFREAQQSATPMAKTMLYVLRTALTGAHLLTSATLCTDLEEVAGYYGFEHVRELLAIKREGERTPLAAEVASRWLVEAERALELLDRARERSSLPEEPANVTELEDYLIELRRAHFDGSRPAIPRR